MEEKTINSLVKMEVKDLYPSESNKEEIYKRFCRRFMMLLGYLNNELNEWEERIFNSTTLYDGYSYSIGTDEFIRDYRGNFKAFYGLSLHQPWYEFNDIFLDLALLVGKTESSESIERKFTELLEQCLVKMGFNMKSDKYCGSYIIHIDPATRLKAYKDQFFDDAMKFMREYSKANNARVNMASGEDDLKRYIMKKRKENSFKLCEEA